MHLTQPHNQHDGRRSTEKRLWLWCASYRHCLWLVCWERSVDRGVRAHIHKTTPEGEPQEVLLRSLPNKEFEDLNRCDPRWACLPVLHMQNARGKHRRRSYGRMWCLQGVVSSIVLEHSQRSVSSWWRRMEVRGMHRTIITLIIDCMYIINRIAIWD